MAGAVHQPPLLLRPLKTLWAPKPRAHLPPFLENETAAGREGRWTVRSLVGFMVGAPHMH